MGDVQQRVCGEERTVYKSSALSYHCVDNRDESRVTRLGSRCLYPLSDLTGPREYLKSIYF